MASIPSGNGTVHACYQKQSGQLRVIDKDAGDTCRSSEAAISFNQKGPTGPTGPKGATGPAGPTGPSGNGSGAGFATQKSFKPGEVLTTSTTYVPLDGPSITVTVPAGGATVIMAVRVEGKTSATSGDVTWDAAMFRNGQELNGASSVSTSFAEFEFSHTHALPAGTYTYEMRYRSEESGATATFRNRRLHITVLP